MKASPVQICDMVTVARYLNLTMVVPELDKQSFWADPRCVALTLPFRNWAYHLELAIADSV
jgi:hypothetical protein